MTKKIDKVHACLDCGKEYIPSEEYDIPFYMPDTNTCSDCEAQRIINESPFCQEYLSEHTTNILN